MIGALSIQVSSGEVPSRTMDSLAAEAISEALAAGDTSRSKLMHYHDLVQGSWARDELYKFRNWRQAFDQGLFAGMLENVTRQIYFGGMSGPALAQLGEVERLLCKALR